MPVSFLIFHFLRKYFIHFDRPYFFLKPKIKRIIQVLWKIDDGWRQTKLDLITDKASPKSRIYFFMKENEKKNERKFFNFISTWKFNFLEFYSIHYIHFHKVYFLQKSAMKWKFSYDKYFFWSKKKKNFFKRCQKWLSISMSNSNPAEKFLLGFRSKYCSFRWWKVWSNFFIHIKLPIFF